MSTVFHPQTDGQTEHYNQELEAYLRIYCAYKPDEWITIPTHIRNKARGTSRSLRED